MHYGSTWGSQGSKDHLLVTLQNGVPTFYLEKKKAYTITSIDSIADGEWHHLALTIPERSCRSSQIQMYIDGDEMVLESMKPQSKDKFICFVTLDMGQERQIQCTVISCLTWETSTTSQCGLEPYPLRIFWYYPPHPKKYLHHHHRPL